MQIYILNANVHFLSALLLSSRAAYWFSLYLVSVFVRWDHKSVANMPQNGIVACVGSASSSYGEFLSFGQVGVDPDCPGKDSRGKGQNHFH